MGAALLAQGQEMFDQSIPLTMRYQFAHTARFPFPISGQVIIRNAQVKTEVFDFPQVKMGTNEVAYLDKAFVFWKHGKLRG
jgi:hypothetical protein